MCALLNLKEHLERVEQGDLRSPSLLAELE